MSEEIVKEAAAIDLRKHAGRPPKKVTSRKHRVDTINRNQLADRLDAFSLEGRTVLSINISRDIGGAYEVVSYIEE